MKTFVLLLAVLLIGPCLALAQVNGVTVEVSLEQQQFLPDEDVVVTLTVKNRSGQTVDLGQEPGWLNFSVQGENNMVVEKKMEIPVVEDFAVRSAQTESRRLNLTPYFSFRQQGRYTIVATVKIPQWDQKVVSKPLVFTIMKGVTLSNTKDLLFGVPLEPGASSSVPEVRKYVLQKATYQDSLKLYFRLTDASETKTFCIYPIGPMVSFGQPETQIDAQSNLHLLYQFYAKSFCYCVINTDGKLMVRQIYDFSQTRPSMRTDSEGRIYVGGGIRKYTPSDLPAVTATAPAFPTQTNVTNQ